MTEGLSDLTAPRVALKATPPTLEAGSRLIVLMFTDIVGSSALKVALGDVAYVEQIAKPHNRFFRDILGRFTGAVETSYTGDGFMATFARVSDAVNAALLFHHGLRSHLCSPQLKAPVQTCIGIHLGESVVFEGPKPGELLLASHAADMCARLMSLASGGQTLLTRAAFDNARQYVRAHPAPGSPSSDPDPLLPELEWLAHGRYLFKGKDEPLEVFEVGAVGVAPLKAPGDSAKAKRALSIEEEQTLGWRPGLGLEIPGKPGWAIDRKLGEGGFGEVWLAAHAKTRQPRVFKFCFDPERLRSFKRELTLFRLIREALGERDDIAPLLDVNLTQQPFSLESEYIEGGNLSQWAASRGGIAAVPLATRLDLLSRVARAVAAAHSVGIIHKDIKPSNIFIRELPDGGLRPMIADFGIGVLSDRSLLAGHAITEAGFTDSLVGGNESSRTGTRLYAPPESLVGKPATIQGDIYALGVLLYQFATGDLARPLGTGWEDDISNGLLREDILACTHRDAARRLSSATDIAVRLEQLDKRRGERLWRWFARNPALTALAVSLVIALAVTAFSVLERSAALQAQYAVVAIAVAGIMLYLVLSYSSQGGIVADFSLLERTSIDEGAEDPGEQRPDALVARPVGDSQTTAPRQRSFAVLHLDMWRAILKQPIVFLALPAVIPLLGVPFLEAASGFHWDDPSNDTLASRGDLFFADRLPWVKQALFHLFVGTLIWSIQLASLVRLGRAERVSLKSSVGAGLRLWGPIFAVQLIKIFFNVTGGFAFLVGAIHPFVRLSLADAFIAFEGKSTWPSIRASFRSTEGSFRRIFLAALALLAIYLPFFAVASDTLTSLVPQSWVGLRTGLGYVPLSMLLSLWTVWTVLLYADSALQAPAIEPVGNAVVSTVEFRWHRLAARIGLLFTILLVVMATMVWFFQESIDIIFRIMAILGK